MKEGANLVERGVVERGAAGGTAWLALDAEEVLLERDGAERGVKVEQALIPVDAVLIVCQLKTPRKGDGMGTNRRKSATST